jgi:hypothetical protein
MKNSAKIFLSHSVNDKEFVRKLANDLSNYQVPVWLDEWELKVGDSLSTKIQQGIQESGWLAVILSKNSVASSWVTIELNAAMATELEKKQVFVLPILIEDCEIPLFLKDKLFADFRKNYPAGLAALLKRLIPENLITTTTTTTTTTAAPKPTIQRQPNLPKPEEQLINIVTARIGGRHPQYIGLLEVRFKLDKLPDQDWGILFENPTSFSPSVHKARLEGSDIVWYAGEDDIKNKKHWIEEWVKDANSRYLPILQRRFAIEEEKFRKSQLDNAKYAELESLLNSEGFGTLVYLSDEIMVGKCSLRLTNCAAPNSPGPITQINFDNHGFIHTCYNCLQEQLDNNHWRLE